MTPLPCLGTPHSIVSSPLSKNSMTTSPPTNHSMPQSQACSRPPLPTPSPISDKLPCSAASPVPPSWAKIISRRTSPPVASTVNNPPLAANSSKRSQPTQVLQVGCRLPGYSLKVIVSLYVCMV